MNQLYIALPAHCKVGLILNLPGKGYTVCDEVCLFEWQSECCA
jgi:hypothetical protein